MDTPIACNLSFKLSSSAIRVFSSAVDFSLRSQLPRDVSNHLEYHPEAPRRCDATTACNQVEKAPLRAAPEGPKYFLDNQYNYRFVNCLAASIRLLLQFDSDDRFSRSYAMDVARAPAPSAHEHLKPLEARGLLIDEGSKGYCFGHHCEG